jgi:hypothetical protein
MTSDRARLVPKLCGADVEVGNFLTGPACGARTGAEASRALLREIEGLPRLAMSGHRGGGDDVAGGCRAASGRPGPGQGVNGERRDGTWVAAPSCDAVRTGGRVIVAPARAEDPQDWGRKFLPANGGCAYIDLDHLELCVPEVRSAFDHVACWHAMLRIARRALVAANDRQPPGRRIQVLVNNSDGQGSSYGSHLSFLVTRRTWDNLFHRKVHHLLYLAACQASALVFTGQGKVGSENGTPPAEFQIAQRADFFECLTGVQTTSYRPIVNSRDETLCGAGGHDAGGELARLHVIFFDSTLCHVASLLKVGVMQIVLAMIEAGQVNPELVLDDPVDAVRGWSRDPTLRERAFTAAGHAVTAIELQRRFLDEAVGFAARGGCDGIVPRAPEILTVWDDTLRKLEDGDLPALARRIDWVLKRSILERVLRQRPDLTWESPVIKHLDHLYAALDEEEGLYWAFERAGAVDAVVPPGDVERFTVEPPEDTRAWARAMLLRRADPDAVAEVDWDRVRLRPSPVSRGGLVPMANPLGFTRADLESSAAGSLEDLIDAMTGVAAVGAS